MNAELLIASNDRQLQRELASRLFQVGIRAAPAPTPLHLVWGLTARNHEPPSTVLLDARPGAFGIDALEWLREDARHTCLIVLANDGDATALTRAELAEAAAVIPVPARPGAILRVVRRVLRGSDAGELLRWTPPRGTPRIPNGSSSITAQL